MLQDTPLRQADYNKLLTDKAVSQLRRWGIRGPVTSVWLREVIKAMKRGYQENNPVTHNEFFSFMVNNDKEYVGPGLNAKSSVQLELSTRARGARKVALPQCP